MNVVYPWEIIAGAVLLIVGQGGLLHLGMKRYLNGLHEDVGEIKDDIKTVISNQHQLDTRVSILERDVLYIKEQKS